MPKASAKQNLNRRRSGKYTYASGSKLVEDNSTVRILPMPIRVWYKPWTWRHTLPAPPRSYVPKARHMLTTALTLLRRNWKVFSGLIFLNGAINLVLVHGLSDPAQLANFKSFLNQLNINHSGFVTVATLFTYLISTSGVSVTSSSGVYQGILLVIFSLAMVYVLRQIMANHVVLIRDSLYNGMYPLVPVLLLLLLLAVQCVPATASIYLYQIILVNHIATDLGEKALIAIPLVLMIVWSFRMVTSTIFAFYVATLPNMTPLRALRSAARLVYKRRLFIWRKIAILPLIFFLVTVLAEVPLILFLPTAAGWVFFVLTLGVLPLTHTYMYTLYRELL